MFKCLIFRLGLTAKKDAENRYRILTKFELNEKLTAQKLSEKCQRIINLRHDTEQTQIRNFIHTRWLRKTLRNESLKIKPCFGQNASSVVKYLIKENHAVKQNLENGWTAKIM